MSRYAADIDRLIDEKRDLERDLELKSDMILQLKMNKKDILSE
jgi:hypothetical protein